MTLAPIHILREASDLGLKLSVELPDTLTFQPAHRCPEDFATALKAHKPALLTLLRLPFVMAHSQTLSETILFAEDDATKAALVEAGAEEWSIYTKDELRVLIAHNRAQPFLPDELCKLHKLKRTFHGRITTK